jgi:hypothetical protein
MQARGQSHDEVYLSMRTTPTERVGLRDMKACSVGNSRREEAGLLPTRYAGAKIVAAIMAVPLSLFFAWALLHTLLALIFPSTLVAR